MSTDFALDWIAQQVTGAAPHSVACVALETQLLVGRWWPLAKAASIFGDEIDATLLASVLNMDITQPQPHLADWELSGGIRRVNQLYCFTEQHIRITAYAAVDPQLRQTMHLRAADALIVRATSERPTCATQIASHFESAAYPNLAFSWWIKAAERAIEAAAPEAAAKHLKRAIDLSVADRSTIAPEDRLAALRLLGPLLAQLKGSGSNDVAAVYAHCLEIAEELHGTTSPIAFDVLWGLNACILVHGRIETASELSQRLLKAAGSAGNETQILLATRLKGLAGFLAVNLNEAIDDFRVVQQLCESTDHTALRFSHASDQGAVARAHQAWAEAIAGEFENSENSHIEALYQAERLKHPHTSAHVMCVLAARAQSLGQGHIAAPLANAGRTIARRHNFEYWEAWADLIRGWHSGLRALETAPAALDLAIQSYKQTGAGQGLPYAHHLRASVALAAGDMATAAATADAGLACCESYGVMFFKAALLLDKSQATSAEPDRRNLIELALVVARRHKAVLFENRGIALRDRSITPDRAPPALVHPAICAQNQFLGHTQGS